MPAEAVYIKHRSHRECLDSIQFANQKDKSSVLQFRAADKHLPVVLSGLSNSIPHPVLFIYFENNIIHVTTTGKNLIAIFIIINTMLEQKGWCRASAPFCCYFASSFLAPASIFRGSGAGR